MKKRKREKLERKKGARGQRLKVILQSTETEPDGELCEEMTKKYQNAIKGAPLWSEMVNEHGVDKAKELLREFRVYER